MSKLPLFAMYACTPIFMQPMTSFYNNWTEMILKPVKANQTQWHINRWRFGGLCIKGPSLPLNRCNYRSLILNLNYRNRLLQTWLTVCLVLCLQLRITGFSEAFSPQSIGSLEWNYPPKRGEIREKDTVLLKAAWWGRFLKKDYKYCTSNWHWLIMVTENECIFECFSVTVVCL